jgi:4'-phosphopantetheinyl transferase
MRSAAKSIDRLRSLDTQVHVWLAHPEATTAPATLAAWRALLSADERSRLERFRRESDGHHFLVAHALARCALSHYVEVAPAAWIFAANRWGRPEIAGPDAAPALRFSLSHTAGLVACAVARGGDCGVDVEANDRRGDPLRVARRVLAARELADLEALPAAARRERFLVYWTLKEAYVKALGRGLSLPLREIAFSFSGERIQIDSEAAGRESGGSWQLASLRPTRRHTLGVALRWSGGPARAIVVREGPPVTA